MKTKMKAMIFIVAILMIGSAIATKTYNDGNELINQDPFIKMVSHSEYASGDTGQVITRLVDWKGDAIAVNDCWASIYYPNKTLYADNALMTTDGFVGDHYYSFTAPEIEGVYEYQAVCEYMQGAVAKNATITNSFQVVPAYNKIDVMEEQIAYIELGTQQINLTINVNSDKLDILTTDVAGVKADTELIIAIGTETNQTSHNTYDYMTGTMATNVNSILTQLGVIEGKIDLIKTDTTAINDTVNTIQGNQESMVRMSTF